MRKFIGILLVIIVGAATLISGYLVGEAVPNLAFPLGMLIGVIGFYFAMEILRKFSIIS